MTTKRFHRWTLILAIIAVVLLVLAGVVGEVNAASPTPEAPVSPVSPLVMDGEPACAVTVMDADAGQDDGAQAWAIACYLTALAGLAWLLAKAMRHRR